MKTEINDELVSYLNFLCKTYDGLNKLIVSTKNRLAALNQDVKPEHQDEVVYLEKIKGQVSRKINKELEYWPVWRTWLKSVPGIGPFIAGNLILLYYYKFIPVCKKCETILEKKDGSMFCNTCNVAEKDGMLKHKIMEKDFKMVSSWWHYLGEHNVDGHMPKKKKGQVADWSSRGRAISYQIGVSIEKLKEDEPYKAFCNKQKEKIKTKNSELKPYRVRMMANRAARKLLLSHFWHVARTIDGKSTEGPYAQSVLGHTNIIEPYYWES